MSQLPSMVAATRSDGRMSFRVALSLFFLFWGLYLITGIGTSGDSRWAVPTILSLLREGNTDLNEYISATDALADRRIETVGGRHYSRFPIGTVLLAFPAVAVLEGAFAYVVPAIPRLDDALRARTPDPGQPLDALAFYWRVEQVAASAIMALALVVFFCMAARLVSRRVAFTGVLVLGFGTSAWSVASTALWQHGPSMLMLTATLSLFLAAERNPKWLPCAALTLAFAYVVRPTNSIACLLFTAYAIRRHPKHVWRFLALAGAVALLFVAYNLHNFDAPLQAYYLPGRLKGGSHLGEALIGNLFSPGRGLFVYSPILIFSIPGAFLWNRRGAPAGLAVLSAAIVLLHWLAISAFPHWWGGNSYGPRLFSDMDPFLVFLLLPLFDVPRQAGRWKRYGLSTALILAAGWSGFAHYTGAAHMSAWEWGLTPVPVDHAPARLWDWNDPAFFRPYSNSLVEMNRAAASQGE